MSQLCWLGWISWPFYMERKEGGTDIWNDSSRGLGCGIYVYISYYVNIINLWSMECIWMCGHHGSGRNLNLICIMCAGFLTGTIQHSMCYIEPIKWSNNLLHARKSKQSSTSDRNSKTEPLKNAGVCKTYRARTHLQYEEWCHMVDRTFLPPMVDSLQCKCLLCFPAD